MSVRVVARIRPLLDKEQGKDVIVHAGGGDDEGRFSSLVRIPNPKNESEEFSFAFNAVYDQPTPQEELFTAEVAPHVKSLFAGLDVTIFAYGVTGTGKTHTMRGGLKLAERGVIPRLLSGVFRRAKKITKDSQGETDVSVALSYYEIYNDKVFDLLEPPEKRTPSGLPLREAHGKTQVVGLTERACEDLKDFERLYIEANNNRVTAATKLNAHSSRSHAILRVKLTQVTGDMVRESTASAIDLAGSEDNRRTDNGKERLIESAAINKSLFVLSQCIDAIGRGERRIPFRESKMTRILSLGQNNGITIMILNLAPMRSYHLDTLSSLNVSSRAKRIEVREIENEVVFKQPPRANSKTSATGIARQPLRPLANAHNIHAGTTAAAAAKPAADKPLKAFSVYSDRPKPVPPPKPSTATLKRTSSTKRQSEADTAARTTKIGRPTPLQFNKQPLPKVAVAKGNASISALDIEAMVEKKVSEILASRAQQEQKQQEESQRQAPPPSPPALEIPEAVQRRLEALERRIEEGRYDDETRSSEGLRFLLAARQHKERGDDSEALKMYEKALPFFPGQTKLVGKIEKLKARIAARQEAGSGQEASAGGDTTEAAPSPQRSPRAKKQRRAKKRQHQSTDEEDYHMGIEADDDDDTFMVKNSKGRRGSKSTGKRSKTASNASFSEAAAATHQDAVDGEGQGSAAETLLDIINSRDIARIMTLQGFGPKKARDLVGYLAGETFGEDADDVGTIDSLAQLRGLPGMGGRAVDRAFEGLVAGGVC